MTVFDEKNNQLRTAGESIKRFETAAREYSDGLITAVELSKIVSQEVLCGALKVPAVEEQNPLGQLDAPTLTTIREQAIRSAVSNICRRLVDPDLDPVNDIYLVSLVLEDFGEVMSEEEFDRVILLRDCGYDQCQLFDQDPSMASPEAHALRAKIRNAAIEYLAKK
jgi:hypothetical protein